MIYTRQDAQRQRLHFERHDGGKAVKYHVSGAAAGGRRLWCLHHCCFLFYRVVRIMRRGSTPTHSFIFPFPVDLINDVEITYCQNDKEVLKKYTRNCVLGGKSASVTLTQEETFDFIHGVPVEIQVRVKTITGEVLPSDIFKVPCDKCLSDEVL